MLAAVLFVMMPVALPHKANAEESDSLTIVSGDERHVFSVELADTPESRARGLMYRRSMPEGHGMLFDFGRVEMVSMWMRNTYIPLDMLFIRADGSIARIARNTEPLSERQISSGEPVLSVFEINAGISDRLGITAGDVVEHPLFSNSQ
ncbi:MAG: DUF192 domain-containing protein [Salinarimonas sp.]|nr:DUF192 domain-containing protein [Salinarimonas sp.]